MEEDNARIAQKISDSYTQQSPITITVGEREITGVVQDWRMISGEMVFKIEDEEVYVEDVWEIDTTH